MGEGKTERQTGERQRDKQEREREREINVLMRDEEGRKKEASKVKQTDKQGKATQHTQGSHFS